MVKIKNIWNHQLASVVSFIFVYFVWFRFADLGCLHQTHGFIEILTLHTVGESSSCMGLPKDSRGLQEWLRSQFSGWGSWNMTWGLVFFSWLKEIKLEINLFCLMKNAHTTLDMPTNPTQKSAWVHKASAIWHYCPSHKKRVEIKMVELQMGLQMWKLKTGTVGHWIAWNLTL